MNKKEEKAFRILEALSEVDEDLLERCNQEKKTADPGKMISFYRKYGKLCVACLCLLVMGSVYLGFREVGIFTQDKASESEKINLMATAQWEVAQVEETVGESAEGVVGKESSMDVLEGDEKDEYRFHGVTGDADMWAEPVWLDVPINREAVQNTSKPIVEAEGNSSGEPTKENTSGGSEKKMFGATEAAKIEDELLPEEYHLVTMDLATATQKEAAVSLLYASDEKALWIRIEPTGLSCDMELEEMAVPFLKMRGDWTEEIPAVVPGEPMQLACLYEDGVLVQYYGELTREQVVLLLQGIH